MSSTSAVVCREIFDENSQPSAEEVSEYAQQLGIDPESESHLLPLAKDGLMQALPTPWKAYYDEKLGTHYYYNEENKKTQWEHPLDNVYRELVKRARDASVLDDTCASVQELLTSEENTKHLERVETKVESDDDDLTTDSENQTDVKDNVSTTLVPGLKRLTPLGRPPLAPLARLDKKLNDLRISPLRRSADSPLSNKLLIRNISDRDLLSRQNFERPKMLFKQQSEIIDLKMHVLNSPDDENFSPLLAAAKVEKGLPLTGKGSMFLRVSKSDLPSPDTDKSLPLDSMTKSDPPKGILREKDVVRRVDNVKQKVSSFDEDRKSVRFKLENLPEMTISPGSNSSSEQNDGQSSIISAAPSSPAVPSPPVPSNPLANPSIILSPLVTRPPLPPRPVVESPREKSVSVSDKESIDSESRESRGASPRRRVLRPPAADYIKPDLFQKNFHKISDLVRPGDIETSPVNLEKPEDKDTRPRSPMIPQKNKISINLMESIESETSIDSPDREFANLDLNDLDESNEIKTKDSVNDVIEEKDKEEIKEIEKSDSENSDQSTNSKASVSTHNVKPEIIIPQIKVPNLDFSKKSLQSDPEGLKTPKDESKPTIEVPKEKNILRISPTPSYTSDLRSPRDFGKPWSPLSSFKPLNKAVIAPQIKSSESATSLAKNLTSPRLDGVIISQGKSSSDNVVVVYQFETQEENKMVKSPLIPDMGTRDMMERNKGDERRRLELALQKELEGIRMEWASRERRLRGELQEELKEAEERFLAEKRLRLTEQVERHRKDMEETLKSAEENHQKFLQKSLKEIEERYRRESEEAERQHAENMTRVREEYRARLTEQIQQLEIENERSLSDAREQFQATWNLERARMIDEHHANVDSLREEHSARLNDLKHDYRAEVEHLRTQHACHLEELRARLANERAASGKNQEDRELADKYRCLKQKYARLKHDVKMSIERRNKRREMSMTTGSETEKSNSHKATQSLERCKEANETSVSATVEPPPIRVRANNNQSEHEYYESANKYNNNNDDWKLGRANTVPSADTSQTSAVKHRKTTVAFREPERRRARDTRRDTGATTDCQDSSDATTADEKPKESINGNGRRRCFTRLKSASTSRLNYSPKRGDGWSSPLESLRQQLRKLDDLEDQFPDLACQQAYSLRYPFGEIDGVPTADPPELEFVRHRALVEREGMRRARAALKTRRAALKTRDTLAAHTAPEEEREATELEVALHRARALLGEKEIRLRHIERALRRLADSHPPPIQAICPQETTSDASSGSEAAGEAEAGGAVLRSLRALHADVRDIWRALDARRPRTVSPETSSYNAASTSQTRMTLSAPETTIQDNSDGGVAERARGLRAWLQTAP
ncbi:uncharacterized protein LOC128674248 isoform X2 [Plodia interpunctella]|uniref:uncharacterized protein LOC128674248 isoform X2 n=1 Tax=Plodia interpunctella TaxID=58824 RepID=UPI0023682FA8|nr:uncharacterized protein LOC128674248 isoform X2 [Plodia interpunctella]